MPHRTAAAGPGPEADASHNTAWIYKGALKPSEVSMRCAGSSLAGNLPAGQLQPGLVCAVVG